MIAHLRNAVDEMKCVVVRTNFDVWKFELESLLGEDQPGFQTHANVCWCSETQWSTDETFSSGFLWLRGTLRSNLAVEQCLSNLTRQVSPKSTARPRMLTMRRYDPKQCYTHRTHHLGNRQVGTRVSRARKGSPTGRQQVRQNAQSLDILSKSFATDVFKGTILKHDVSRGDGKENQYAQETNPEEWSALRST